jgi:hypothetical protein
MGTVSMRRMVSVAPEGATSMGLFTRKFSLSTPRQVLQIVSGNGSRAPYEGLGPLSTVW